MSDRQNQDPLLTRREAAEYLGVNERTLANWHSGKRFANLPVTHVGRLVKYRKSDLEAFLQSQKG